MHHPGRDLPRRRRPDLGVRLPALRLPALRRPRLPTPRELIAALSGRDPARGRLPISDPTPDPGLFGPDSVTWRVMREPILILGGGRALLMQAAHPLVAQGAIDHSSYATDPFGRLERTLVWVTNVTFGTTSEARAATRTVNALHRRVRGELPAGSATAQVASGRPYTATDPRLLLWVHATFVDTMLVTHDAFVGTLDESDRDAFVREWHAVAALMGVPRRLLWDTAAELRAYVTAETSAGPVSPGSGSRHVATTIVRPPLGSSLMRPGWGAVVFATVGLLPAGVRRGYGIPWTPAHTAAHLTLRRSLRTSRSFLPERFRTSPVHDFARRRVAGEMVQATGSGRPAPVTG